jgi:pimeloyl-ACP methyl ester carboxylesterase
MMRAKQRQGVKLSYKIASEIKQPNFVLIHNAGGNHQFLKEQFAHLKQLGQVLSVDLRGHGESDKPKQDYTVESFADDVAYLCHEHEIQKAIFIGLNYGANIAIELANKTP